MTISTVSTCPSWCAGHTSEDGVTLHERRITGERWDIIMTHDADDDGTTVDVGLPGDRGLTPSEALALGVALVEAAATVGQAEAEQETVTPSDDDLPMRPAVSRDVPSTERVRRTYAYGDNPTPAGFQASGAAFDAWLATQDARILASHTVQDVAR